MIFSNANIKVKNFLRSSFHLSLKQVQWNTWEKTQKQNNKGIEEQECLGLALH